MAAPAHDDIGLGACLQDTRVAEHVKHGIGNAMTGIQVKLPTRRKLAVDVNDVPEDREQQFAYPADHFPIHEGAGRRAHQRELHSAILLHDIDVEVAMLFQHLAGVVRQTAGVQNGEGAAPEQLVLSTLAAAAQAVDFMLGENLQRAFRHDFNKSRKGHGIPVRAGSESGCYRASSARYLPCPHSTLRCTRSSSPAAGSTPGAGMDCWAGHES